MPLPAPGTPAIALQDYSASIEPADKTEDRAFCQKRMGKETPKPYLTVGARDSFKL